MALFAIKGLFCLWLVVFKPALTGEAGIFLQLSCRGNQVDIAAFALVIGDLYGRVDFSSQHFDELLQLPPVSGCDVVGFSVSPHLPDQEKCIGDIVDMDEVPYLLAGAEFRRFPFLQAGCDIVQHGIHVPERTICAEQPSPAEFDSNLPGIEFSKPSCLIFG